jgi:hypothetical protein
MFEKFAKTPARKSATPTAELPKTIAFLTCLVANGVRLSYGALTASARHLGEDFSGQIPAQRGAKLVKTLPVELQPHVCRKAGNYAKGTTWNTDVPGDLRDRPVISLGKHGETADVVEAIEEWQASLPADDSAE